MGKPARKSRRLPALDIARALRQARSMESPPILPGKTEAPKPRRRGRAKYIVISLLGVGLLGGAMYWAMRDRDPAVKVQTEKIVRHSITETVIANG